MIEDLEKYVRQSVEDFMNLGYTMESINRLYQCLEHLMDKLRKSKWMKESEYERILILGDAAKKINNTFTCNISDVDKDVLDCIRQMCTSEISMEEGEKKLLDIMKSLSFIRNSLVKCQLSYFDRNKRRVTFSI